MGQVRRGVDAIAISVGFEIQIPRRADRNRGKQVLWIQVEELAYKDCKCRDYRSRGEQINYHGEDTARRMRRPSAFSDGGEELPTRCVFLFVRLWC